MPRFISFIIPAHNEEGEIGPTLSAIAAAAAGLPTGVGHEVIVACDACSDRTAEIAREHGALAVEFEARHIAAARNRGAAAAHTGVPAEEHLCLFVDADTRVSAAAVVEAIEAVRAGAVGGGASVRFEGEIPRWSTRLLPVINALFRMFRFAGGCFFFVRRDHFEAAGRWDEGVYAGEEINTAKALKRRGRFHIIRSPVLTSGRKMRTYSGLEVLRFILRNALSGGRMLKSRDDLDIWYGPRRPDPGAGTAGNQPKE